MHGSQSLPTGISLRSGNYLVRVSKSGVRKNATCDTLDEAIKEKERLKAELVLGIVDSTDEDTSQAKGGGWTLQQAVDKAVRDIWSGRPAEDSQTIYAQQAVKFFGKSHAINLIDEEAAINFISHLVNEVKNKPSTISKKVSCLRVVLEHAAKFKNSGRFGKAPPKMKSPKRTDGRLRYFTLAEEKAVLNLFRLREQFDHADVVASLLDSGCRPIELYNVTVADIVLTGENPVMGVYGRDGDGTKNGTIRSIIMTERLLKIVKRRMKGLRSIDKLFPYSNEWLRHQWDYVRGELGFGDDADFVPYTCRHTCASRQAISGVPIQNIQKWLGHKKIEQTMKYAHLCPESLVKCVAALEDWKGD